MIDQLYVEVATEAAGLVALFGAVIGGSCLLCEWLSVRHDRRLQTIKCDDDSVQCAYECGRAEARAERDKKATRRLMDARLVVDEELAA